MVNCPTCEREIRVPTPPGVSAAATPRGQTPRNPVPAAAKAAGQLFERDDFDVLLEPPSAPVAADPAPLPPRIPPAPAGNGAMNVEPVGQTAPAAGVVLSSRQVTTLIVLAVLLAAGIFAGGVAVGRYLL
jgi:hypothetical protein